MSKKKMNDKTNAMRILEQQKIPYKEHFFEWDNEHLSAEEVAQHLGVNNLTLYKTLFAVGNNSGPIVAVLPGNKELNLKKLAKVSNNKKVEMLPLKELEETTGYIRGGCSPIGMKKHFPMFLAEESKKCDTIIISAGRRGRQIELAPQQLLKMLGGQVVSITEEKH